MNKSEEIDLILTKMEKSLENDEFRSLDSHWSDVHKLRAEIERLRAAERERDRLWEALMASLNNKPRSPNYAVDGIHPGPLIGPSIPTPVSPAWTPPVILGSPKPYDSYGVGIAKMPDPVTFTQISAGQIKADDICEGAVISAAKLVNGEQFASKRKIEDYALRGTSLSELSVKAMEEKSLRKSKELKRKLQIKEEDRLALNYAIKSNLKHDSSFLFVTNNKERIKYVFSNDMTRESVQFKVERVDDNELRDKDKRAAEFAKENSVRAGLEFVFEGWLYEYLNSGLAYRLRKNT